MKLKLSGRLAVLALAAGLPVLALSGCAGRPGVAAYGKDFAVSEEQVSQVSGQLAKLNPQIERRTVLGDLMVLDNGGREVLREGNCPGGEQVEQAFQLSAEQYRDLAPLTRDWLRLRLCALGMEPQYAIQLAQQGIEPLNPQTQQMLKDLNQRLEDDDTIEVSPRYRQALPEGK